MLLGTIIVGAPLAIYCGVDEKGAREKSKELRQYLKDTFTDEKYKSPRLEVGD